MRTDCEWNAEQIARLTVLWLSGMSATQIGRELGVSKNAVLGKKNRLNLGTRKSPIRPRPDSAKRPVKRVRRKLTVPALPSADTNPIQSDAQALSILSVSVEQCCQFIAGPGRIRDAAVYPRLFCGRPTVRYGASWCAQHHKIVFTPARRLDERGIEA